jgi:hypothetical protein
MQFSTAKMFHEQNLLHCDRDVKSRMCWVSYQKVAGITGGMTILQNFKYPINTAIYSL